MGGTVPQSFYLSNQINFDNAIINKKMLVISPRSREELEVNVELPGSILR